MISRASGFLTALNRAGVHADRVKVRRFAKRGRYDRATIDAILDSGLICNIGFQFDGYPVVIPTFYWREGDRLFWHGSVRSRMLQAVEGAPVCVTITLLDGIVAARSAFNHSANYRSVTLFGTPVPVTGAADKRAHMHAMMESILPDRWQLLRPLTDKELAATRVMSIAIGEASAKIRSGPPADIQDAEWPVWAGVIPLSTRIGDLESDREWIDISADAPRLVRPRPT